MVSSGEDGDNGSDPFVGAEDRGLADVDEATAGELREVNFSLSLAKQLAEMKRSDVPEHSMKKGKTITAALTPSNQGNSRPAVSGEKECLFFLGLL